MYVGRKGRGMGDLTTLAFPFLGAGECQVGAIDPATGDTIAGCPGAAAGQWERPTTSDSFTVTAKAYPTWLYVGAAVLGSVLLLKVVKS
jgi:hypothetical protein